MVKPNPDFADLTVAERIELAVDLWDSIREAPEVLEVTEAQREELDRRLAEHEADPDSTIPWSALRQELLRRR